MKMFHALAMVDRGMLGTHWQFRNICHVPDNIMWIASNSFACVLLYFGRVNEGHIIIPLALHISASILHKQEMINSYMYPLLQHTVSHNVW